MAAAQPFGRFGYTEKVEVPGFEVDRAGFRIVSDRADRFQFEKASTRWNPLLTTETSQTIGLSGVGRSPLKLRVDLLGAGIQLYFQNGLSLGLGSTQSPYLSWIEGSVGPGVPTPAVEWLLVSFRDSQPPLLISTPGRKTAYQVSGKAGAWRLMAVGGFQGWLRATAPNGGLPMATNSASALGNLLVQIKPKLKYLVGPVPTITGVDLAEDADGITATWNFDRPYAVVPIPALLAPVGGYPLRLETPTYRLDSTDPSGPISVVQDKLMRIRFPVRRIPTGRPVTLGAPPDGGIGTVSPLDIPGVGDLAFANLTAARDDLTKETTEETLAKYLQMANYAVEPHTNQRLPFGEDGAGMDLAAAHALLMQSATTAERATSEPNSLLTSVVWRRDWRTWTLWTSDEALSRRAGALAALAAAICPEPKRRLDAGMLEAGLAAQIGLRTWRRQNGHTGTEKLEGAPYEGLRHALFAYVQRPEGDENFVRSMLSEIRVYGDHSIRAQNRDGQIYLSWAAEDDRPTQIILASAYPLEAEAAANLDSLSAEDALGFTVIKCTPKGRGDCDIRIRTPSWAAPLPKYAPTPKFRELLNEGSLSWTLECTKILSVQGPAWPAN